jgi:hypothetical protein
LCNCICVFAFRRVSWVEILSKLSVVDGGGSSISVGTSASSVAGGIQPVDSEAGGSDRRSMRVSKVDACFKVKWGTQQVCLQQP